MHFRYRSKRVDGQIWTKPSDFLDKSALVIAVLSGINGIPEFFPLRKGKLIKMEKEGDTLHVYFRLLSNWVNYSDNNYDSLIKRFSDIPNGQGDVFLGGKFITKGNLEQIVFSSSSNAWEGIIEKIGDRETFNKSIFYRIVGLYDASSRNKIPIIKIDKSDDLTRGYEL
jgi:hypothetical protein